MYNKKIPTGIICAAMLALVSIITPINTITAPAYAAKTSCLPGILKHRLNQIRKKFGPIRVVSTHRHGARIAGTGKRSYHASCRAVDFHPPKGKYRAVVKWLKSNHKGGVGTYSCGMHHIHLDNGPKVRFHKCVNRYGAKIRKSRKRYTNRKTKPQSYALGGNKKPYKTYKKYRKTFTTYEVIYH